MTYPQGTTRIVYNGTLHEFLHETAISLKRAARELVEEFESEGLGTNLLFAATESLYQGQKSLREIHYLSQGLYNKYEMQRVGVTGREGA